MRERRLPCESKERREQKQRKRRRERGLDFLSDAAKKMRYGEDFWGSQNQIREEDNWGGIRGRLGKISHPLFHFLAFTLTFLQK